MSMLFRYKVKFWIKTNVGGKKTVEINWPLPRKYIFLVEEGIWKEVTFVFLVDPLEIEQVRFGLNQPSSMLDIIDIEPVNEKDLIEIKDLSVTVTEVDMESRDLQTL